MYRFAGTRSSPASVQDASGLLVIVPASTADVHLGGIGALVIPEWVTTGAIGEITEGRLVLVIGRITTAVSSDLPFGYKLGVDDGSGEVQIFINTQTESTSATWRSISW